MATFYRTRITIDVLHEHPTPDEWEVADIVREGDPGSYVIDESDHRTQLRSYEPKPSKPSDPAKPNTPGTKDAG